MASLRAHTDVENATCPFEQPERQLTARGPCPPPFRARAPAVRFLPHAPLRGLQHARPRLTHHLADPFGRCNALAGRGLELRAELLRVAGDELRPVSQRRGSRRATRCSNASTVPGPPPQRSHRPRRLLHFGARRWPGRRAFSATPKRPFAASSPRAVPLHVPRERPVDCVPARMKLDAGAGSAQHDHRRTLARDHVDQRGGSSRRFSELDRQPRPVAPGPGGYPPPDGFGSRPPRPPPASRPV